MTANFLDFYDILVNQLIGDPTLFIILSFLIILIILAKMKAPNTVVSAILITISLILYTQFPNQPLLLIIIIVSLAFIGWNYSRLRRE